MFAQTHTCLGYILLGRWQSYSFVLSTRYVYWLSPWHYFRFIRSYFIWNKWRCQWLLKSVFFSFGWYHFISLIQVSHYILGLDNNNNHIEIQLCMQSMDKWTKKKSILIATGHRPKQTKNISCRVVQVQNQYPR